MGKATQFKSLGQSTLDFRPSKEQNNPKNPSNVSSEDLPVTMGTTDETHAAQQYCTAVVENEGEIDKMPKYSEYMAHVKGGVKRAGEDVGQLEEDAKKDS